MSSYISRFCEKHGEWDMDVDCPSECPTCEERGETEVQILRAEIAKLKAENERLQSRYDAKKAGK